jgi:hypothetical protein
MNTEHFDLAGDLIKVSRKIIKRLWEKGFSDAEVKEMFGYIKEYGKLCEQTLAELVVQTYGHYNCNGGSDNGETDK